MGMQFKQKQSHSNSHLFYTSNVQVTFNQLRKMESHTEVTTKAVVETESIVEASTESVVEASTESVVEASSTTSVEMTSSTVEEKVIEETEMREASSSVEITESGQMSVEEWC